MGEYCVTNLPSNRTFTTVACGDTVYHTWFRMDGTAVSMITVNEEVVYDQTKHNYS